MNIVVITQMYSQPDDAGDNKPTKTVNYFVKEWVKEGHNVIVFHCSSRFPLLMYFVPKLIKKRIGGNTSKIIPPLSSRKVIKWNDNGALVYRLPMTKLLPGRAYSTKRMDRQKDEICAYIEKMKLKPDLVIGHFANPSLELTVKVAECYNAKSSIVFHQDCNETTIQKYRINNWISRVDAIGVRSVIEAAKVKQILNMDRMPFICCSGVPNEAIRNAVLVCDKHAFDGVVEYIYVGSLIKRKHVDSVIKAFVNAYKSSRQSARLTIIGGGAEEEKLKKLVSELESDDLIRFTGRISRDQVMEYMKKANILTLISENEVFGMVYIEAMLQGCLVIASKGEGFDGFIIDGENGFLCTAGQETELEEVYNRIYLLSKQERNCIGQNAIDYALNYSEEAVAKRYLRDVMEFDMKEGK